MVELNLKHLNFISTNLCFQPTNYFCSNGNDANLEAIEFFSESKLESKKAILDTNSIGIKMKMFINHFSLFTHEFLKFTRKKNYFGCS